MNINKKLMIKRITRHVKFSNGHSRLSLFWLVAIIGLIAPWAIQLYQSEITTTRECIVSSTYDGDTMRVQCGGEQMKMRLHCIDAPEIGQKPWGRESRDYLRGLAPRGSSIQVRGKEKDKYGRLIGEVYMDGKNLNLAMVRAGQAVVYRQYCEVSEYYAAEKEAKKSAAGIWSKPGEHQRPWRWRHH